MSKPPTLRFGIQSLDRLIGSVQKKGVTTRYGIDLSPPTRPEGDTQLTSADEQITSSVCLAGPDGTGKSVFSLHLASQYLADCLETTPEGVKGDLCPKILYISTDLAYTIALRVWNRFDLNCPLERREPLLELKEGRKNPPGKPVRIGLQQYFPSEDSNSKNSIINYLEISSEKPTVSESINAEVCFVDLATRTAGDDWGFVHRLLSMLDEPEKDQPRHLMVLDAVEGFETLVGDLNAFGERSSRRSRIAQVMRLAAAKCHLLLVVEERRDERFPEEFVTDVVVRLRNVESGRYLRRTVEIEKARGQLHVRGQHPYVIRDGGGSTTGEQINADDPKVVKGKKEQQAYAHVFLSPDHTNREIMAHQYDPRETAATDRFAAFGIPYLDNMLGGSGQRAKRHKDDEGDTRGLACGSATALLGDSLTQKSQLGEAFLSRAFYPYADELGKEISTHARSQAIGNLAGIIEKAIPAVAHDKALAKRVTEQAVGEIEKQTEEILARVNARMGDYEPATVMFTTRDVNNDDLAEQFCQWLKEEDAIVAKDGAVGKALGLKEKQKDAAAADELIAQVESGITWFAEQFEKYEKKTNANFESFKAHASYQVGSDKFTDLLAKQILKRKIKSYIKDRTICRRFEIHDIPSAILLHIFQRNIEKAQRIMLRIPEGGDLPGAAERFRASWRIRVVIDDLNSFRNIFPEISDDPLMLPSLLFMLGREGVTSLIIDSQSSGSPELSITERFDSSVRELVQTRIYTWRLPFYGENRVAISLIPPISHEYRGVIRELRWETKDQPMTDRALTVDPHFELYMGLERGQPQPVPLEVRLYAETPSVEKYIATEEKFFREIFTPIGKANEEPRVIARMELNEYEALRDACHIQRDTRLDHTTILQVNEFWWLRRPRQRRAGAFRTQWNYLSSVTATLKHKEYCSEPVVDTFLVFQPSPSQQTASAHETGSNKKQPHQEHANVKRRLDFFDEGCGYDLLGIKEGEEPYIDRVPYTWDFGFLLCNGKAWEEAASAHPELSVGKDSPDGREIKVKEVWDRLYKATQYGSQTDPENSTSQNNVSWRLFLAATKIVAEFQSYRTSASATAFDFTMLVPESFSCLILEMWLSEAYESLKKYENKSEANPETHKRLRKRRELLKGIGQRRWYSDPQRIPPITLLDYLHKEKGESLETIFEGRRKDHDVKCFSLELYKVWLLLTEAINFTELVDSSSHLNFEFKSRDASPQAVSARHWYKTASKFIDSLRPEHLEDNWVPVRLPGHFSVRADWFLAVAGGSRSSRLADHALDLLSSQRSNVTRLQDGIGLPTRRLFDTEAPHLRTRLISVPVKGKPLTNVEYEELRRIGASKNPDAEEFYWLWRSGIAAYNRHSRIWHKWLNRSLLWWHSWRQRYGSNWNSGFEVYDLLTDAEFGNEPIDQEGLAKLQELESWKHFDKMRDILIAELEQAIIFTI